jgi:hypothetical protein
VSWSRARRLSVCWSIRQIRLLNSRLQTRKLQRTVPDKLLVAADEVIE